MVAFLDEPDSDEEDIDALAEAIRQFARTGLVVTITHNVEFARTIADQVLFVGDGRLQLHLPAEDFFNAPSSREAAQWVKTGSCSWPERQIPPPNHFNWILPNKLAAMGLPGLNRDLDEDLASLVGERIGLLVTLTHETLPRVALRSHGIEGRHFPIRDMQAPSLHDAAALCADIERRIKGGQRVAVHCHAGLGRTGTIVACVLCWLGLNAELAVSRIRKVSSGFIQTEGQLRFVELFDETYGGSADSETLL